MGLDMYLFAHRTFDPNSDTARSLLDAVADEDGKGGGWLRGWFTDDGEHLPTPDHKPRHLYVGGWGFSPEDEQAAYAEVIRLAEMGSLTTEHSPGAEVRVTDDGVVVRTTCLYWRKANAIHQWFVEKVQDGVDECQVADVTWEQLAHLRDECQAALDRYAAGDRSGGGMPTARGFFFGSTDIDEWYAQDLRETIDGIDAALRAATPGTSFAYHSSW